jgi:hypothetical protein
LAKDRQEVGRDWPIFDAGVERAWSWAEQLYFIIDPQNDGDRSKASDFWESYEPVSDDFVRGFALGAMDVWDEVSHKL